MATKTIRTAGIVKSYDDQDIDPVDGQTIESIRSEGQCRLAQDPTHPEHCMRLKDMGPVNFKRLFIAVADITDPSAELALYSNESAGEIICVQIVLDAENLYNRYIWDYEVGEDPISSPYRVQGANGGVWIGTGPMYSSLGLTLDGHVLPSIDDQYWLGTDEADGVGAVNKRWLGRFAEIRCGKTPEDDEDVVRKVDIDGLGEIQIVSVADIGDPAAELAAKSNADGNFLMARAAGVGSVDDFNLYFWDQSSGATNVPYVVQGDGGKWVGMGPKYSVGALSITGLFTALGFNASGAGSIGTTLSVGTALTVGTTLGVTGVSTLTGAVNSAAINTQTGQPCMDATFSGSLALASATDVAIVWSSETFDQGSNFATSTFTVPTGGNGKYLICGGAVGTCAAGDPTGLRVAYQIFKNGSLLFSFAGNSGAQWALGGSRIASLVATDTITIKMRQDTADAGACTSAHLSIMKVA